MLSTPFIEAIKGVDKRGRESLLKITWSGQYKIHPSGICEFNVSRWNVEVSFVHVMRLDLDVTA